METVPPQPNVKQLPEGLERARCPSCGIRLPVAVEFGVTWAWCRSKGLPWAVVSRNGT